MSELSNLLSLVERLEATAVRLESSYGTNSGAASKESSCMIAYEEILTGALNRFLTNSKQISPIVSEQSLEVQKAFEAQKALILFAIENKKVPLTSAEFQQYLDPVKKALEKVCECREENRGSKYFNHLSTVSEGIPGLGWVLIEHTPAPFLEGMKDSSQFYANRVIRENKESDRSHVDWANSFVELLSELHRYVKEHHTTGLAWDSKPPAPDLSQASTTKRSACTSAQHSPAKLPKVEDSRADRMAVDPTPKVEEVKEPCIVLSKNKWHIENYKDENLTIDNTRFNHIVYARNCHNCTIYVKEKVTEINIDHCSNTTVIHDFPVSAIDVANSTRVRIELLN
ncbi:adenylate cyclase-associated CAP [Basidiobolus meristosporus CBS 931.73]|uniref:Adenylyl cyclase-associated protein n=1 Tax=Basidiobolus meristosporus CBS 931.73 TaxID=1314790 RepID=A0A1Y1Y7N5_9FUNG|nr:adenylate cyclase-associated CAP [Basidiobolus meristosporus CBS 931.73]|eukprot:ORX93746.1 adenylate cyclase-associated CAP [Basidiobolus meristosporus CBS 931.73]